ncbi:MAG: paraquat-inducible protein A, partial [Halieaceae bacterium]|nr:paraquat-inducible protein A [Halieaceae bacterium]
MTFKRKLLTVLVIITALGLLYPGVTQPVLTLTGTIEKSQIVRLGIDTLAGTDADSQARQMLNTMSILLGFDQMEGQV